jgi:hypothetical protein
MSWVTQTCPYGIIPISLNYFQTQNPSTGYHAVDAAGVGFPLEMVVCGPDTPIQYHVSAQRPEQSFPTRGFHL